MTYQESFDKIQKEVEKLDASKIEGHYAYQFNITGEDEGIFYVEIKDGKVVAEPYDYKDNDGVVTAASAEILKYFAGENAEMGVTGDKLEVLTTIIMSLKEANKAPAKKTTARKPSTAKKTVETADPASTAAKKTATRRTRKPASKKTSK